MLNRPERIRRWIWRIGFFDGEFDGSEIIQWRSIGGAVWVPLCWRFFWLDNPPYIKKRKADLK